MLEPDELGARVRVAGAPARVLRRTSRACSRRSSSRGLAAARERLGVEIYERTPVTAIRPGAAVTAAGDGARALGGARDRGLHRRPARRCAARSLPVNSSMIVTEPLPARRLGADRLGAAASCSATRAHVYVYLQRTADGRIAIGGRGVPYRYGSRTDRRGETAPRPVAAACARSSPRCSRPPPASPIAHAWCGVLGVPRDWCAVGRRRPGDRAGVGRRLRRRGRRRGEPRRAHAARPDPRRATRS